MLINMFITGLGGQGVLTIAKLFTRFASDQGLEVSLFNSKGMAQRGGRVTSEIRIVSENSDEFGSRISAGEADILVGMEIGETLTTLPFLKKDGILVMVDHAIVPATMMMKKEPYPTFKQAMDIFSERSSNLYGVTEPKPPLNIYLLGVLASILEHKNKILPCTCDGMESVVIENLKRNMEENLATFRKGAKDGRKL
jgi:indolepyruvate ferredoxin oxidoreductase beta subunit